MGKWCRALLMGFWLGVAVSQPAVADDTEIFRPTLPPSLAAQIKPNVLFIVDTSSSMLAPVSGAARPFDPATTYTGACASNRIYWSTSGAVPDCNTTLQYFDVSALRCAASNIQLNAGGGGLYQDRLARYDATNRVWVPLSTSVPIPPHIECEADRSTHGDSPSSNQTFIVNGKSFPWQSNQLGEAAWSATGDFYTLFSANYANYYHNPPAGVPTRLEIVKAALNQIIGANSQNISAGLMRFDSKLHCLQFDANGFCTLTASGNKGGPIVSPVVDLSSPSGQAGLQAAVTNLTADGFTPLAETLYEAALYFRAEKPYFGANPPINNALQSAPTSIVNGLYQSPVTHACQKSHIVYLTDGQPTFDQDADALIAPRLAGANPSLTDSKCDANGASGFGIDNCMDELSELLATQDISTALPGDQTVSVHTVGFLTNQTLLREAARRGNGQFFNANNTLQLSQAFADILTRIQEGDSTFSGPSVSVNAFNRLTNRKDLYFALFEPSTRQRWAGNIKRYELDCLVPDPLRPGFCKDGPDQDLDPDPPVILDAAGQPAIDPTTGFFASSARSVWTPSAAGPDGDNTRAGGAANVFGFSAAIDDPASRNVYTFAGTYAASSSGTFTPASGATLSASTNALEPSNAFVTNAMIYPNGAAPGQPTRNQVIAWAQGIDVLDVDNDGSVTDARHEIGDSLHSKPVLFDYGTSATNTDLTLFTTNNDGYLHAINTATGNEIFSFIPQELLPDLPNLFSDQAVTGQRPYGLDGPLTLWLDDKPKFANGAVIEQPNGRLDIANGERLILYFGQRRGGRRYFAVDVTSRASPKLLWKIEGGQGDFVELGQTWSAPRKARVKLNGAVRDVIAFGGGYDVSQDLAIAPQNDAVGRAIYMVDAITGQRVWSAQQPGNIGTSDTAIAQLTNSIPSDITIFDLTGDGLDDRIYVGDTRAQLFRIDINNQPTSSAQKFALGARIAALQQTSASSTPGVADNRRFFYRPDVAFASPEDAPAFLAVSIGSGYRAHPLNTTVEDRFYMIRDAQLGNITTQTAYTNAYGSTGLTEAELADVTFLGNNGGPPTPANPTLGWFIKLADLANSTPVFEGEKVLAESVTFANTVLFTTFRPPATPLTVDCKPNQGNGFLYAVNLFDGAPVEDFDQSGPNTALTEADRKVTLLRKGIPPAVTILFSPVNGVTPLAIVATETLPIDFSVQPVKTYWFQQNNF